MRMEHRGLLEQRGGFLWGHMGAREGGGLPDFSRDTLPRHAPVAVQRHMRFGVRRILKDLAEHLHLSPDSPERFGNQGFETERLAIGNDTITRLFFGFQKGSERRPSGGGQRFVDPLANFLRGTRAQGRLRRLPAQTLKIFLDFQHHGLYIGAHK